MGFLTKIVSVLKRHGKEGQHTIEYAVLMILIMAGIVTMGRYVVRSWNANLKGWEDSAIDSMEDPLIEVDPPPLPDCTGSDWTDQGCGLSRLDVCTGSPVVCAPTQMTSTRSYRPPGCQCVLGALTTQCTDNDCCCETPVAVACGDLMSPGAAPPACTSTGLSPTIATGCPYGQMGYSTRCGGNTFVGCRPDISCILNCPTEDLSVVAGEGPPLVAFTSIAVGLERTVACPPGFAGDPTRLCRDDESWGPLQNPCVNSCGDGICDASIDESCLSCTPDCGNPGPYDVCPDICIDGRTRECLPAGGGNFVWWCRPGPNGRLCNGRTNPRCCCGGACDVVRGCFIAGTKITLADGSLINIEDVAADMEVKASSQNNTVTKLIVIDYNGLLFAFNESENYFVTDSHAFMTTDGWKSMNPEKTLTEVQKGTIVTLLEVGDILITAAGEVPITKIKSKPSKIQVYNFEVDGSNEYYADGYQVHNARKK